jgi:hypothetical protein
METLSSFIDEKLGDNELNLVPQLPLRLSEDEQQQVGTPFIDLDRDAYSDSDLWMTESFAVDQVASSYALNETHPFKTTQNQRVESMALDDESLGALPAVPSYSGLLLPPGLHPMPKSKAGYIPLLMQSVFSEHVETLEHHIRSKLDMAPDRISCQR